MTNRDQLHEAANLLAGCCDWAQDLDGQGFSKSDAMYGHDLAETPTELWTVQITRDAWETLRKYAGQLEGLGCDFSAIAKPPIEKVEPTDSKTDRLWTRRHVNGLTSRRTKRVPNLKTITLEGDVAVIRFKYDRDLVAAVKAEIPGRRYNPNEKAWTAELTTETKAALIEFASKWGFEIADAILAGNYESKPVEKKEAPEASITIQGDLAIVRFPYSPDAVASVKTFPGRRWNGAEKYWTVPFNAETAMALVNFAATFSLDASSIAKVAQGAETERKATLELSKASDADLEVEGLGGELMDFQRAGVQYAVAKGRCLIADEMGLGKTWQALATLQARDSFPALIVVPASLKINWERETNKVLPGRTVTVLNGKAAAGIPEADVVVINYDVLKAWLAAIGDYGFKALVLDEAHYVKNPKAIRTKAVKALAKDLETVLLLTGTPILSRPAELISPLQILGLLDAMGGWKAFVTRYCKAYRDRFGWNVQGADNLVELNERLRGLGMVRRTKDQVLSELPSKRNAVVPLELDNRKKYEAAREDVVSWVGTQALMDAEFKASLKGLSRDEKYDAIDARRSDAEYKARKAEQLVRIEALKKVAVDGKLNAALDWIENFLETGEKLVVFATHRDVVAKVAERFGARTITGDTPQAERQAAVDAFQNDDDCRLIVGNIRAMGVGLTLTAASNVAFLELGWTPGEQDQATDRCHRIGQTSSVTAWYLVADDTIDNEIFDLIERKRSVVNAATDGTESKDVSVLGELIKRLRSNA